MVVLVPAVLLCLVVLCSANPYKGAASPRAENNPRQPPNYQKPWFARPPPGQQWGAPPPRPVVNTPTFQAPQPPPLDNRVGAPGAAPPIFTSGSRNAGCEMGGKSYKVGDKWTGLGGCVRHTCVAKGKITTLGCPAPEPSDQCTLSDEDPRQPWPLCCAQPQCSR